MGYKSVAVVLTVVAAFILNGWWQQLQAQQRDVFGLSLIPREQHLAYFYGQATAFSDQSLGSTEKLGSEGPLVCCNVNLDLVVNGAAVLQSLLHDAQSEISPADAEQVSTVDEFLAVFLHYFEQGSAAERFVSSQDSFLAIINHIETHGAEFEPKYLIGGNAGLMANHLASLGHSPKLFGPIGSHIGNHSNGLVHHLVELHSSSSPTAADEIHLILEYAKGAQVTLASGVTVTAPRANRFIISHDLSNMGLAGLKEIREHIRGASTRSPVLILSGTHLMEGLSSLASRIALAFQIRGTVELHQGPSEHLAHLELASVGDRETLGFIGRELVWVAASLGLNEQELGALYRVLGGTEYTLESFKAPSLQTSIDAMVFILNWVPRVLNPFALMRKENQLSRIHMHFLSYHVVCTTSRLSKQRWTEQGTRRSVQTGALTATRKACGNAETGEFPDVEQVDLQWDTLLAATKYKLTWNEPWIDVRPTPGIFCSVYPVLVCNSPLRTVGLGDAISSSGLFAQIQSKD